MSGLSFEATETPVLPAGIYRAKLSKIEQRQSKQASTFSGDGTYLSWQFEVTQDGHDGELVYANSSTNFGPKANARKWAEGILGRKLAAGETVREEALVGIECQLGLSQEFDKDGDLRNKIDSVYSLQTASAGTPSSSGHAAPPAQDALFEDEDSPAVELAGHLRRYETAKQKLGWLPEAYTTLCLRSMGWLPAAVDQARHRPINFASVMPAVRRQVLEVLEAAMQAPDQYDETGDLRFDQDGVAADAPAAGDTAA
jgi:hypothetical protein